MQRYSLISLFRILGDQADCCAVSSQIRQFKFCPNCQSVCSLIYGVNTLIQVCSVELLSCLHHTYSILQVCKPRTHEEESTQRSLQTFTFTQSASPSHLGPGPQHGSPPTACSARQDFRNPQWCSSTRWPGLENQEALLSCAHL